MARSALIVGATGLVGSHCLKTLLQLDVYESIHVLARRELNLKLTSKEQKKLHVHLVDLDNLDNVTRLFNVNDVCCCLGTNLKQAGSVEAFKKVDFDYCLKTSELSKQHQVEHLLIVTAVNAKSSSLAYYSKIKGQLQNELKALELNQLSIFQPSLLLGERNEFRLGESLFGKAAGAFNLFLPKKMSSFKAIEGQVVGKAMAILASDQSFKKSQEKVNFYYYDDMQLLAKR